MKNLLTIIAVVYSFNVFSQTGTCGFNDILSNNNGSIINIPGEGNFVTSSYKWQKKIISYYFLNQTDDIVETEEWVQIRNAFKKWESVTDLLFVETCNEASADIRISWVLGEHGDGHPFAQGDSIIAHAFFPPPYSLNFSGDIHFDDGKIWSLSYSVFDKQENIYATALHEIGHSLGLHHSYNIPCVMYKKTIYADLYQDDISGIQSIYGAAKPDFWSLTGPTQFCPSASYSITIPNNLPMPCNVQWSVTGPAVISGPSNLPTVTVNATGLGTAELKGLITYGCNTFSISKTITSSYTPILSGPDKYCTTANYLVSGLPANAIVTWTTNGAVQIVGSNTANPVTVSKLYDGTGTLSANITSNCQNKTLSRNILIGKPKNQTISAIFMGSGLTDENIVNNESENIIFQNNSINFSVPYDPNVSYQWKIDGNTVPYSNSNNITVNAMLCSENSPSWKIYKAEVLMTNSCGTTVSCREFKYYCKPSPYLETLGSCMQIPIGGIEAVPSDEFILYPNPSGDLINISHESIMSEDNLTENVNKPKYKVKIYNSDGILKIETQSLKGENLCINTSNLADGIYYVHIQKGDALIQKQIIIKH